ncbi:MAG: hypothetical protein PHE25_02180 [Candidatus Gracilibacteria bacterium]|nr:hypothetical protein [Candidatus Gracilibacteria bacterium]
MNLHIHIGTNLEYFRLLNEGFLLSTGKTDKEIASFFMANFPGELAENISPQYEVNFMAIRELKKIFGQEVFNKIDGIYYGSDNCEYLIPYKNEIIEAINLFKEFDKKYPPHKIRTFTLVTPYVGDVMLEKLEETLSYLNELNIKNPVEIVVNDFGVLRLLNTKYKNLKPIFGRLILKLLKTPLIDTYSYETHPAGELIKNKSSQEIDKMKTEIIKWQLKFYASSEVSLNEYKGFLQRNNISRVAIDYMEKREELYINQNEIGIDLYYPWALVFTGRLCDTSAIGNPARGYYATDDICGRACNKYDVFYKIKTIGYNLIQRGNGAFRSELNLDYLKDDFINNENNRIVFSPFISV